MNEAACPLCVSTDEKSGVIAHDDHWLVRRGPQVRGSAGWLLVQSRRHLAGIHEFDDEEAADIGRVMRDLTSQVLSLTGAVRVYTGSLNEAVPHFHCHLVPRYSDADPESVGFNAFLQSSADRPATAADGLIQAKVESAIARSWIERRSQGSVR